MSWAEEEQGLAKPELLIQLSADASDEELAGVVDVFTGTFRVTAEKSDHRLSEAELGLLVTILVGVVSSALWDTLKGGIRALLERRSTKIRRDVVVIVKTQRTEASISEKGLFIRRERTEKQYRSLDELFDDVQ